jgi:AcrR family transcriptional regulator
LKAVQSPGAPLAVSEGKPDERRTAIVYALDRCIRDKGYAHTSLNDVAAAAGMSPSHLLYYVPGKEAILELYLRASGASILADVTARVADAPAVQLGALASYFFGGRFAGRVEQGLVLELFGQAVHRRGLKQIKADFDRRMKAHLTGLFRQTPRLPGLSAADAAESAYALLVGFIATSYFDERLELKRARELLRAGMLRLAGLPAAKSRITGTPSTRRVRRTS